jgi:peptide/nickel transport system substrate-binding protein
VLKAPNANLPLVLASFVFIMPAGTTSFDPPIGTGPFKFDSWRRGTSTQLVKNRQWWKSNLPYLDELEIVNIADSQARLNALQGSQVDIISGLDFTQAKALEGNSGAKLLRTPGSRCIPFYMRLDYPAFEDNRARTAFKLAVDRQELVDNVLLGYGSVANDMFGAGYPSYPDDVEQREYDPEKAKSLLAAAGQSDVAVTLTTSKVVPGMLEAATAYAQQAKEAGIRIKLQEVPADQYWTGQYFLKVPFAQEDWSERFELTAELALLSDAPFNETVWKRPDFDRRFVEAGQTADEGQRADIYKELQREVWAEGGYIIWGYQDVLDAAKPGVNGIKVVRNRTLGNYDFSEIWLS